MHTRPTEATATEAIEPAHSGDPGAGHPESAEPVEPLTREPSELRAQRRKLSPVPDYATDRYRLACPITTL